MDMKLGIPNSKRYNSLTPHNITECVFNIIRFDTLQYLSFVLFQEKKAQARDAGMFRKEVTPAEIADETEKERRLLQLNLSEYCESVHFNCKDFYSKTLHMVHNFINVYQNYSAKGQ